MAKPIDRNRTCQYCGKSFEATLSQIKRGDGKYCSRPCFYKHNSVKAKKWNTRICPTCRQSFTPGPGQRKQGKGIYCSVKCAHEPKKDRTRFVCSTCGNEFELVASLAKRPYENRYCSWECFASQPKITIECKNCGKLFDVIPSTTVYHNPQYCSKDCYGEATSGENHPRWKGGVSKRPNNKRLVEWRIAIFERDDYTCQHCGKRGGDLHAHHIKPWKDYPKLRFAVSNGMTLCIPCHIEVHR